MRNFHLSQAWEKWQWWYGSYMRQKRELTGVSKFQTKCPRAHLGVRWPGSDDLLLGVVCDHRDPAPLNSPCGSHFVLAQYPRIFCSMLLRTLRIRLGCERVGLFDLLGLACSSFFCIPRSFSLLRLCMVDSRDTHDVGVDIIEPSGFVAGDAGMTLLTLSVVNGKTLYSQSCVRFCSRKCC